MTDNQKVVDFSGVSPQRDILASYPKKPAATSKIHLDHRQMEKRHELVGIYIVFAKDDPNGLWEIFHKDRNENKIADDAYKPDIKSVDIYCDTLKIHGALCIPEANVTILARKVIWATADASLTTTPLAWQFTKAQKLGVDGMHGRQAGNITFAVAQTDPPDGKVRLYAQGGDGQSPGPGKDGQHGASVEARDWVATPIIYPFQDNSGAKQTIVSHLSPQPIRVKRQYLHFTMIGNNDTLGTDKVPTDGTPAIAPGIPGTLGNGGKITTNQNSLSSLFSNSAGQPGVKEKDYKGGAPGYPSLCNQFTIEYDRDLIFGPGEAGIMARVHKDGPDIQPQKGEDKKALPAVEPEEKNPTLKVVPEKNIWVHPLSLVKVLEFARELFLSGARKEALELLTGYEAALNQPMPASGALWPSNRSGEWVSAQLEVAAMLHRLRGHLDYFGNRGGYIPLLSLQGAIKLYKNEAKRCLGTLLLVAWVTNQQDKIENRNKGLKVAIGQLNADTKLAAQEVIDAHKEIIGLRKKLRPVEEEISNLQGRMSVLRSNLESEARGNLETIRMINFTANMAATLCMVIPVGQPVLGAVGSLASIATNYATSDDSQKGLKALKATGERMTGLADDLVAKAEAAKASAVAAREEKTDVEISEDLALKHAKNRASAVTGLGTVISSAADEMAQLQAPQSEVDEELEKLKRKSAAWKNISNAIKTVNKNKVALQLKLAEATQRLGESYSRITANTTAIYSMRLKYNRDAPRLTPEGASHLRQMGQRARLTLQKYLYLMVKAYETTVFKTIDVEWNPMALTKKIQELIGAHGDFSETMFSIGSDSELLKIYLDNVETVRGKLIDHLANAPSAGLDAFLILCDKGPDASEKETSGFLDPLNSEGEQVFDPLKAGIVHADSHLMMLNNIELETDIKTDPNYPPFTPTQQVKISIQPLTNGTVRRDHNLYAVYGDRLPVWSAQLTGGKKGKLIRSTESEHNKELLDFIVEDTTIQHKLARPPLWSNYLVTLTHEIPEDKRPKISRIQFKLNFDAAQVDKNKKLCVLDIREEVGAPADEEFVITCRPGDMREEKGRENGLKNMVRIYHEGTRVTFKVPPWVGNRKFKKWELIGYKIDPMPKLDSPEISFTIRSNVVAKHAWSKEEGTG